MTDDSRNSEIFKALINREEGSILKIDPPSTTESNPIKHDENIAQKPADGQTNMDSKTEDREVSESDPELEMFEVDDQFKEMFGEYLKTDGPDKKLLLWKMIGKLYGTDVAAWRVVDELLERFDSMENRICELKTALESIDNKLTYVKLYVKDQNWDTALHPDQMDELLQRIKSIEEKLKEELKEQSNE